MRENKNSITLADKRHPILKIVFWFFFKFAGQLMKPGQEKARKQQPTKEASGSKISLARKIIIALFIVGYWVFFYWFRET